jgi:hypothetical protein
MRKMKMAGKEKVAFLTTLTVGCYTLPRRSNSWLAVIGARVGAVSVLDGKVDRMRASRSNTRADRAKPRSSESDK